MEVPSNGARLKIFTTIQSLINYKYIMLLTRYASSIARYVLCIAGHGTEHVDCGEPLHSDEGRRVGFTALTAGDEHRNLW